MGYVRSPQQPQFAAGYSAVYGSAAYAMSGDLKWLWAACRRARDTEWADFCDSGGGHVVRRAAAVLDAMWFEALDRRNATGYATPRNDSLTTLAVSIDRARERVARSQLACTNRNKYAGVDANPGAFHVHARLALMEACAAVTGVARFWPRDFPGIAAVGATKTAQRQVP